MKKITTPDAPRSDVLAPRVYTIPEVAALVGIGLNSAYELARTGKIPAMRFGRRVVVSKAALDAMLERGRS